MPAASGVTPRRRRSRPRRRRSPPSAPARRSPPPIRSRPRAFPPPAGDGLCAGRPPLRSTAPTSSPPARRSRAASARSAARNAGARHRHRYRRRQGNAGSGQRGRDRDPARRGRQATTSGCGSMMLAPSASTSMNATVLGDADMTLMRVYFVKPQAAIAMTLLGRSAGGNSLRPFLGIGDREARDHILRDAAPPRCAELASCSGNFGVVLAKARTHDHGVSRLKLGQASAVESHRVLRIPARASHGRDEERPSARPAGTPHSIPSACI